MMEFDGSVLTKCIVDENMFTDTGDRQRMTLHCLKCNTVLGDSFDVCGEIQCMDAIMCLKVTADVVISDTMKTGHKGELANCIYSSLKCHGCCSVLGKVIHSAPSRLANVRSIFLLHKKHISCYILNSSSMVKASTLTFDVNACRISMNAVKQEFEAQLDQMLRIKSRLADWSSTSVSDM